LRPSPYIAEIIDKESIIPVVSVWYDGCSIRKTRKATQAKEAVMKTRVLSTLVIIVVATLTAIVPLAGGASVDSGPLKNVFFAFVSAIIVIQLVPAVMLLGCLAKSAFSGKEKNQEN
jgi:hypothetical protein